MLIREVMKSPVITIPDNTSLKDTYALMQERHIRHLPVTRGGSLVGVITDRDLRLATSHLAKGGPKHPETSVSQVMASPPLTADPDEPVEEAAMLMRRKKIGCLPVLEDGQVIGIVTAIDLMDAIVRLLGVEKPSARLELRLADRPGELAKVTQFLAERHINIHSLVSHPETDLTVRAIFRVGTLEVRPLADALRKEGIAVVWPPAKPLL